MHFQERLVFTKNRPSPDWFRVFWKHENHLHASLPTTNWMKRGGGGGGQNIMEAISGLEKNDSDTGISTKREEKKKRNASASATHSHSCEVSTPLYYTSAATRCPFMYDGHGLKTTTFLWDLCRFPCCGFEMVLQRREQVRQP